MKRAPIIPKVHPSVNSTVSANVPAAPMVDSLISRVGAMAKGNVITLPVCGRDVKFVLETITGPKIAEMTQVWEGNERDQDLLNEESLDDLIPSFLLTGQQNPAFGRKIDGLIEVADGSRRRMAAILTASEYRILIGDLDDEQMDSLCKLGNDYRPTSAYERGNRYQRRLDSEFKGNISALAEAENISRKVISRCLYTARLPKNIIALFSHPGELSARAGEQFYRNFLGNEQLMLAHAKTLEEKKKAGAIFEPDELMESFRDVLKAKNVSESEIPVKRELIPGALARYKGTKVFLTLDRTRLPEDCIEKIERLLSSFKQDIL